MNDSVEDRELALEEEDRLPWLEAVDSDDKSSVSTGKLLGLLGSAALLLAVIGGGVWWWRNSEAGPSGDDARIAADKDPYKVPAEDSGMKVEGQGDTALATSEGAEATGKMDNAGTPEAPMAGTQKAPAAVTAAQGPAQNMPVNNGGALQQPAAPAPAATPAAAPAPAAAGTGLVQLGAYNSEAAANQAYGVMAQKHAALSGLGKSVVPAAVNGTTMYRLRVSAGGNAAAVCAKLKAAGANCMVVR